jgi:hypothetical protein
VIGKPDMTVVGFGSDVVDIFEVNDIMSSKGWHLNALQRPNRYIRVSDEQMFSFISYHTAIFHVPVLTDNLFRFQFTHMCDPSTHDRLRAIP